MFQRAFAQATSRVCIGALFAGLSRAMHTGRHLNQNLEKTGDKAESKTKGEPTNPSEKNEQRDESLSANEHILEHLLEHLQTDLHIDVSASDPLTVHEIGPGNKQEYDETELCVTESQYEAINHPAEMNTIYRVRAGPGSGKTFTLIARIAQLLSNGTKPEEVLVLLMANRSVESLKVTLCKLIGAEKALTVEISTFHSFCAGLLEQYGSIMNSDYTKQNIFDETTWRTMISFFLGKLVKFGEHAIEGSITAARLSKAISNIMLGKQSVRDVAVEHQINAEYVYCLVDHLKKSGLIRYEELIADATQLMRYSATCLRNGSSVEKFNMPRLANCRAVFVDEFQDVYPLLSDAVQAIIEYPTIGFEHQCKHLTITGDPNQSIYEFLGTHQQDMGLFHTKIPRMQVTDHQLLESFRCTQPILDASVEVSLKDPHFRLQATKTDAFCTQKPVLLVSRSGIEEYHKVTDEIVRLLCHLGGLVHLDDIAVLTKTNDMAIAMQSVLKTRYGLPSFKLSLGNQWVASRLHIFKQILGVIAGDTSSSVSLMSILLLLDSETGGRKRVSKLFNESLNGGNRRSLDDTLFLESYLLDKLLQVASKNSALATAYKKYPAVLEKMAGFLNQVQSERLVLADAHARDPLEYGPVALVSCLQRMARLEGIAQYLKTESNEISKATPLEILESFNDSVHNAYGKYASRRELQLQTFLDYFLQTYDSEVVSSVGHSIKVSTVHSAKGLEFPIVFVLGQTMYGGSWDNILQEESTGNTVEQNRKKSRATQFQEGAWFVLENRNDAASETKLNLHDGASSMSRLLYVALTRARSLVYVGCRKTLGELLAIARAKFTASVPDLAFFAAQNALHAGTDEGACRASKAPTQQPYPDSSHDTNPPEEQSSHFEQIINENLKASYLSSPGAAKYFALPFLACLAQDVKRPIPLQQKLELGWNLCDSIMRKNPSDPLMYSRYASGNSKKNSGIFVARKRHVTAQSATLNQAANKAWHFAKHAVLRQRAH